MDNTIEKIRPTWTFDQDKINELKNIAPECFADGKINWEVLKETFGEFLEEDSPDIEHFGLFWPGKREARRFASVPSKGTLVPAPGEGVDEETTKNIFIEGENLEVLKILQKSYAGKVKMIYIDQPYNTGNDFVYDDNFTEPLDEYLKRTGQTDEKGRPLTTNKKADGRFHSKWLSMTYPRLRLARNLLRDDGVIFLSIDDNEVHNLRLVMNEVFGEENFVDQIIWKKRYGGGAKEKYLVTLHEYILFYSRDINFLNPIFIPSDEESKDKYYKGRDEKFEIRGPYRTHPLEAGKAVDVRPNLVFPIPTPDNKFVLPKRQWYWSKERVYEALENNELEFIKDKDGNWTVHSKQYWKDNSGVIRETKAFSIIDEIYTQHGTNESTEIWGDPRIFSYPKPSRLIKKLISIATEDKFDDIILDFFAGSGTTGHAVMDLNAEDGGNRQFILVQMPEQCDEKSEAYKAGYKNIAEICKERIRRVGKKIRKENEKKENENRLDFGNEEKKEQDLGFKVYKLAKSNYKEWQDYNGSDIQQLEELFENSIEPLVPGWTEEALLSEIMLIEGYPLDSKIEQLTEYQSNKILLISSEFHWHKLIVCLDKELKEETVKDIKIVDPDIFICLDSAITNEFKLSLQDKGRIKTI